LDKQHKALVAAAKVLVITEDEVVYRILSIEEVVVAVPVVLEIPETFLILMQELLDKEIKFLMPL
jgi:hypothetical protein